MPKAIYSSTQERFRSTFVYTNAVPQCSAFNQGYWAQYERRIKEYAQQCTQIPGILYLITGTAFGHIQGNPLQGYNQQNINDLGPAGIFPAINIPNSMWTAGCCVHQNGVESFAVIGNNLQNVQGQPDVTLTQQITVAQLHAILQDDAMNGQNVNLFPGNAACVANNLPALPQWNGR